MTRILKSPGIYVQGPDEIDNLYVYLKRYGKKPLILISSNGLKRYGARIEQLLAENNITCQFEIFGGHPSKKEINRLCEIVKQSGNDIVVGAGGGKIIDTVKGVAHYMKLPLVIVPTVASTDAPCSSLGVIYKENDEFDEYISFDNCPNVVLVDTKIIVQTAPEFLVAGMGDALATYYEARAVQMSGKKTRFGAFPTKSAFALAKESRDIIIAEGLAAKLACEKKEVDEAFENVVEANTYLSGVGFESGGTAAAHAMHKGFTFCPEAHELYHGRIVAFCLITQLILENAPRQELDEVIEFMISVGLPVCFEELGLPELSDESLRLIAENTTYEDGTLYHMPFMITELMVFEALKKADAMGREYRLRV